MMGTADFADNFKRDATAQVTKRASPVKEEASEQLGVRIHSLYPWKRKFAKTVPCLPILDHLKPEFPAPPGVAFADAPGRGGRHAERIQQGFGGILQVDGYADYNRLIASNRIGPDIQLAYSWAHARRKRIEITRTGPAPIAEEGLGFTRELYAIEADIRDRDPESRLAARQECSAPILARLDKWMGHHRARASAKSSLGEALAYTAPASVASYPTVASNSTSTL